MRTELTRVSTYGIKFAVVDFQSINNCDPLSISSSQSNTKEGYRLFQPRWNWVTAAWIYLTLQCEKRLVFNTSG
ncbi:MAG: hypothetical protein MZV63_20655 [Marinilabiliales bacterium]|nr:hypothetical protein [Marinilabiliales bacterium]